jgi:hypothetical protein
MLGDGADGDDVAACGVVVAAQRDGDSLADVDLAGEGGRDVVVEDAIDAALEGDAGEGARLWWSGRGVGLGKEGGRHY